MITTATGVQDKFITLNGLRFHYREWGREGAPSLVLLHGLTGHARSWDGLAAAMADRFRVLALDQRGHGESDWAQDYHIDRRLEDLDAFARALELKPFALLGHSMGGIVAYLYPARYPDALTCTVIGDVGPDIADIVRAGALQPATPAPEVWDDPEDAVRAARAANPRAAEDLLRRRTLDNLVQRPDGRWVGRYDPALRIPSADRQPPSAEQWALLPRISCPTLIVRGALTPQFSRETAERMVREIPRCRLVEVADSGHSVPLDNPSGFLAAVRPFLLEEPA